MSKVNIHTSPIARNILFFLLLAAISTLIFTQQFKLINYLVWEDEFETIVAARMMAKGSVLYKEIFNQHGPLTFALGLLLENIGFNSFKDYRLSITLIQLMTFIAFALSPVLKYRITKFAALLIVASYILLITPGIYGHTYTYQNLVGMALLVLLSQFIIPQSFYKHKITELKSYFFLILLFSIPFFAVTYFPVVFLLFILVFEMKKIKTYLISIFLALVFNAFFISMTSDWRGYFAYHYYLNATILSKYYPNQSLGDVPLNIYRSIQPHFIFIIILFILAGLILIKQGKSHSYKYAILILAMASLLIRGVDFQALPFYYAIAGFYIVILTKLEQYRQKFLLIGSIGILAMIFLILFQNQENIDKNQVPQVTDFQQLNAFFTDKNDKVFSYTFKNSEYILADRLPASFDYFYLPSQAEYYKNPIFGVKNDICIQLKLLAPKVGYFEKYDWSKKLKWDEYATCVNKLLKTDYYNLPFKTLYIRKDLLINESKSAFQGVEYTFKPSKKLEQGDPLEIDFPDSIKNYPAPIEKIGILFATYGQELEGSLQLEIRDSNLQVTNYEINGQDISDNRYTSIDLKKSNIGEIYLKSNKDAEISIWESGSETNSSTCILLKFTNGKFYLTPGCLPF